MTATQLGPWNYRALFLSGFIARLPYGIAAVGLLAAGTQRGFSPGITGLLPTAFTLALALATPWWGRRADRHGLRQMLLPCALITAVGSVVAAFATRPANALIGAALIGMGCPPIGAMMRAVWTHLLPDGDSQRRAQAWESIASEGVHIIGRVLTAGVSMLSARLSLLLLGAFGLIGSALLMGDPHTAGVRPATARPRLNVLTGSRARRVLLLTTLLMCCGHGAAASALVGTTRGASAGAALMALWGVGSAIGTAFYLRSDPTNSTPARTIRRCLAVFAVLCPLTAMALPSYWALAATAVFVLGLPISPTVTGLYLTAATVAAPGQETETNAFLSSAVVIGFGIGTATAGFVDASTGRVTVGLTAATVFTVAALLVHLLSPHPEGTV